MRLNRFLRFEVCTYFVPRLTAGIEEGRNMYVFKNYSLALVNTLSTILMQLSSDFRITKIVKSVHTKTYFLSHLGPY